MKGTERAGSRPPAGTIITVHMLTAETHDLSKAPAHDAGRLSADVELLEVVAVNGSLQDVVMSEVEPRFYKPCWVSKR